MSTPRKDVGRLMCRAVELKVTPRRNMSQYSLEMTFKSLGRTNKNKKYTSLTL